MYFVIATTPFRRVAQPPVSKCKKITSVAVKKSYLIFIISHFVKKCKNSFKRCHEVTGRAVMLSVVEASFHSEYTLVLTFANN